MSNFGVAVEVVAVARGLDLNLFRAFAYSSSAPYQKKNYTHPLYIQSHLCWAVTKFGQFFAMNSFCAFRLSHIV